MNAIDQWHRIALTRDAALLHDLLDPDAVFESPVVHSPQRGREVCMAYLLGAMQVIGGDKFRYTGEWRNAGGAVLEFESEIDGISVNGVDIVRCTDDGQRIVHFKVMIRPLKAIEIVHRKMGEMLAKAGDR
ncbi:nuclear transport factor 2 family protein [Sphingomonas jaspsi]|uniref:nuclear transport factor 2 family protein n=1 Tax=Sphingomonas jaspsi TaxID=392409 RepID=UPI0004BADFB7|nr:nuclear transport factor 2 family protein [Sphingomonas jaspsi]